jgi:hypothetical protein
VEFTHAVKWAFHSIDHYRNGVANGNLNETQSLRGRLLYMTLHLQFWSQSKLLSGTRVLFERVRLFCFDCRLSFFKG